MLAGLVLAGGQSSRFESDKALAVFAGRSFLETSYELLAVCDYRAVGARGDTPVAAYTTARGWPVVYDVGATTSGPLAGIRAGLSWAAAMGADSLAIMPCDMPLLPRSLIARLRQMQGTAPVVYAASPAGPQPLCSIWRIDVLADLDRLAAGEARPRMTAVLAGLGAVRLLCATDTAFRNINTVADASELLGELDSNSNH